MVLYERLNRSEKENSWLYIHPSMSVVPGAHPTSHKSRSIFGVLPSSSAVLIISVHDPVSGPCCRLYEMADML